MPAVRSSALAKRYIRLAAVNVIEIVEFGGPSILVI